VPLTARAETTPSQVGEAETPTTTRRKMIMSEVLRDTPAREIPRDRLWSVEEVSYFLGVPVGTLYSWRVQRRGPACHRVGRFLRYRPEDVSAWLASLGDWATAG